MAGLFDPEQPGDDPAPDADAHARGVELSPEELAAIREATRAGTGGPGNVVVVSRLEDRQQWTADFVDSGVEPSFVGDPHQLIVALRDRDIEIVIIDADACASGGLPALAVLRNREPRPTHTIVVASQPTRTHVVSCLAAGATGYLARPFELEQLLEQLRG